MLDEIGIKCVNKDKLRVISKRSDLNLAGILLYAALPSN